MQSFRDLIDLWPSLEALADDAGANVVAVRKWRQRGSIPPEYWRALIAGAAVRNLSGIDADALATIAAGLGKPPASAPEPQEAAQ